MFHRGFASRCPSVCLSECVCVCMFSSVPIYQCVFASGAARRQQVCVTIGFDSARKEVKARARTSNRNVSWVFFTHEHEIEIKKTHSLTLTLIAWFITRMQAYSYSSSFFFLPRFSLHIGYQVASYKPLDIKSCLWKYQSYYDLYFHGPLVRH